MILSNTDRDIIEHTLKQHRRRLRRRDHGRGRRRLQAGRAHFERALDEIGDARRAILHVAFGFKYDIGPAQQLGFRTAWVNRKREERPGPGASPTTSGDDLWPLADLPG